MKLISACWAEFTWLIQASTLLDVNSLDTEQYNHTTMFIDNDTHHTMFNITWTCWAKVKGKKVKVWFYIALYPVRWTAQSALHFPPLADLFIPTPFSASLGSILAMQQLRNDYSLTFPPLSIARYSFIQLSRLRRREVKENAQTSKR